jgi:hypothetical protein
LQAADRHLHFPANVPARGADAALLVRQLLAAAPAWRLGARGPAAYDCWSMTQLVQAHLFGRNLLPVDLGTGAGLRQIVRAVSAHAANGQWSPRDGAPSHGDAVTMAHLELPFHVGTWLDLDRGVVLHHTERAGLCIDRLSEVRGRGFNRLIFHRYTGGGHEE